MPDGVARSVPTLTPRIAHPTAEEAARYGDGAFYDFQRNGAAGWESLGTPTTMDFGKTNPDGMYLQRAASGSVWYIYGIYRQMPKFPSTYTIAVSSWTYSGNYNAPIILWFSVGAPASTNVVAAAVNWPGTVNVSLFSTSNGWSSYYDYNPSTTLMVKSAYPIYLRVRWNTASNMTYWVSRNGLAWSEVWTGNTVTVKNFGIGSHPAGPAVSANIDWMHVV